MERKMRSFLIIIVGIALAGCASAEKKGKREVLLSADKELDILIEDHYRGCKSYGDRLSALKEKVKSELEKVK